MSKFWRDEEVKSLFECVKDMQQHNKPLSYAFVLHANKYNRHHSSVKNYYYYECKHLKSDIVHQKRIGINLNEYNFQSHSPITSSEKSYLLEQISLGTKQGKSIRECCLDIAGGDIKKMQRYQNFYYLNKQKKMLAGKNQIDKQTNLINFGEQKQKYVKSLSDNDINTLFLGLVRLIKSEALNSANDSLKRECEFATSNYQRVLNMLKQKEQEVDKLKSINKTLNDSLSKLKQQLQMTDKQNI